MHQVIKCPLTLASLLTPGPSFPFNNFLRRPDIELSFSKSLPELFDKGLKWLTRLKKLGLEGLLDEQSPKVNVVNRINVGGGQRC